VQQPDSRHHSTRASNAWETTEKMKQGRKS
jgi:hypothetical protein